MANDQLREEVLLFLDFMSKYAHLDLQLLTLRQLLAQFEKETDSLLDKRDRRLFRDLTLGFVARRHVGQGSATPAAATAATARKAYPVPPPAVLRAAAAAPNSASTVAPASEFAIATSMKSAVRLLSLSSSAGGTGASPAGSDCSQVSLDGIAGLVRQSGARILAAQQQQLYTTTTTTNSIIRVPMSSGGLGSLGSAGAGQSQVIHLSVQRIAPMSSAASLTTTTATATTAPSPAATPLLPTPTKLIRLSEDSNSGPVAAPQQPPQSPAAIAAASAVAANAEGERRSLSVRFSDLLRVHKESGLEFPRRELASAPDLVAKVDALESWLLGRGLAWPLTLEGARLFARSGRLAAATPAPLADAIAAAGDDSLS